jgi:hypothetical protein
MLVRVRVVCPDRCSCRGSLLGGDAMRSAPVPRPQTVEQQVTGVEVLPPAAPVTEHARLSAGTADLWRELVHLCMETP